MSWQDEMQHRMESANSIPRLSLSLLPSFYQNLKPISDELDIDLWCKRDDMTAFGFGGNKTRKLDFLVAEALQQKATHIIAVGAVQSNFCRMAAAYASVTGLKCTLVLGGAQPKHTGNHLLSELFGAECHYVAGEDWQDWEEAAAKLEMQLLARGEIIYRMPIGGSTPLGALGYVYGFVEMLMQAEETNAVPEYMYFATSSGGTHAGLLVGQEVTGWEGTLQGIAVAKDMLALGKEALGLATMTGVLCKTILKEGAVHVDDSQIGEGYGLPTNAALEAQELFARKGGIVLDTVYTAKAAAGLIADARSGKIPKGSRVVFLHTGGSPEVWA
jgi:L-cysteate sulfo-lyase